MSSDFRAINFGPMRLDEEKELADQGGYHNEITVTSSNANAWYLKVNVIMPLTSGANTIPLNSFKWQLTYSDGRGTVVNTTTYFKGFSLIPDLTYISGPQDNAGTAIHLRFKYSLKIPEAQAAGVYNTVIRFTLTEIL